MPCLTVRDVIAELSRYPLDATVEVQEIATGHAPLEGVCIDRGSIYFGPAIVVMADHQLVNGPDREVAMRAFLEKL